MDKVEQARSRICLAVDVESTEAAFELVDKLSPYIGLFKIGKELHIAAGNEGVAIVQEIYRRSGGRSGCFLDLKIHDTPMTVKGASRASAVQGVAIMNVHVAGGEQMCRFAMDGAAEGADKNGIERPKVIGVTILTSLSEEDLEKENLGISYQDLLKRRTELAREWGLDGIVCPASEAGNLEKEFGSDFLYVTPGISYAGVQNVGQKQLYTPDLAVRDCSNSILVVGSAITKSADPVKTAKEILELTANNL